jgi:hypothetical protein
MEDIKSDCYVSKDVDGRLTIVSANTRINISSPDADGNAHAVITNYDGGQTEVDVHIDEKGDITEVRDSFPVDITLNFFLFLLVIVLSAVLYYGTKKRPQFETPIPTP